MSSIKTFNIKTNKITENVFGIGFYVPKEDVTVNQALQKLANYENIAESYGLDVDTMLILAKSQIKTVTKCNELTHQIERMAEYISNFDNDENICKKAGIVSLDSCTYKSCIDCIVKYFESEVAE